MTTNLHPHPFSRLPGWVVCLLLAMSGCSSAPPAPTWQVEAKGAMERAVGAYLEGLASVQNAEMRHAHSALARTGQPQQLAQAELLLCAAQTGALDFSPCTAFEALRVDASDAQRSYAAYLQGQQLSAGQMEQLPAAQRPIAARGPQDATALPASMEPLALLVAAANLLRRAQCPPIVVDQAIEAASAQGWRRPLRAWLGVKRSLAAQAGNTTEVERLERRLKLLEIDAKRP